MHANIGIVVFRPGYVQGLLRQRDVDCPRPEQYADTRTTGDRYTGSGQSDEKVDCTIRNSAGSLRYYPPIKAGGQGRDVPVPAF